MASLQIARDGDVLVLHGEFDMAEVDVFDAAVSSWSDGDAVGRDLTLDLSDLSFIDSSGIRSLLRCAQAVSPNILRLRGPNPMVKDVLEITAISHCPNVELG